jgi:anti-anti-sigma factor
MERSATSLGQVCLAIAGEIDLSNVERLRETVNAILGTPGVAELVLDLGPLDFIDSLGVRTLVEAKGLADGQRIGFSVVNARDKVLRVLTILGVDRALAGEAG